MSDGLLWGQTPGVVRFDLLRDPAFAEALSPESTMFARAREAGGLVLRGAAVTIDDRTVLLVGPPASGASTLAGGAVQAGAVLVADGALAIDLEDGVAGVSGRRFGGPSIALWPAGAEMLGLDGLDPVAVGAAKIRWEVESTTPAPRRVDAIVALDDQSVASRVSSVAGAVATSLLARALALPEIAPQLSFERLVALSAAAPIGACAAKRTPPREAVEQLACWLESQEQPAEG